MRRDEPAISFAFLPEICRFPAGRPELPCRAEWEGSWVVPEEGVYSLLAEVRHGGFSVSIDGHPLAVDGSPGAYGRATAQLPLSAGMHTVRIEAQFAGIEDNGVRLRLGRGGSGAEELLLFGNFGAENGASASTLP